VSSPGFTPYEPLLAADLACEIARPAGVSPDFHNRRHPRKLAIPAWFLSGIPKTRVPSAFCAKPPHRIAQNPVTRLWTACTRLKSN